MMTLWDVMIAFDIIPVNILTVILKFVITLLIWIPGVLRFFRLFNASKAAYRKLKLASPFVLALVFVVLFFHMHLIGSL